MSTQHGTVIRCQAPHPHERRHGEIHGVRLSRSLELVEPTGALVGDLEHLPAGSVGAFCQTCKVVSVYRIVGS